MLGEAASCLSLTARQVRTDKLTASLSPPWGFPNNIMWDKKMILQQSNRLHLRFVIYLSGAQPWNPIPVPDAHATRHRTSIHVEIATAMWCHEDSGLVHVVLYACQPCHVSDTIGVDGHNATLFASVHLASTEAKIGLFRYP